MEEEKRVERRARLKQRVYALVKRIPPGRVVSYALLARVLGTHPRVIGRILAESPGMPLVPCHRVVHADGTLGGYAFGGMKEKERILQEEGVHIRHGRVAKEAFLTEEELMRR